jgi:hypothetical protein
MVRFRKSAALAAVLAVAATALPGCVIAIGGKHEEGGGSGRVKKLEERMKVVEDRLGIAPPAAEAQ